MSEKAYERLSAQDSTFVMFDAGRGRLAIGAIALFEPGSGPDGEPIGIERFRRYVASRLHLLPRYRQRLQASPVQGHPIWVDDERFDLTRHVRHVGLPAPGREAQLKELAAHIISQPLDLARPAWELWLIEGLRDSGFAVVAKVHHCMVDGVSGVNVLTVLFSPSAEIEINEPLPWRPRPHPGWLDFLSDGIAETADWTLRTLRSAGSAILNPLETANQLVEVSRSGAATLNAGLRPPPDTPLNRSLSGQRRIEWCDIDLAEVKDLKKRLDGTVNDVVLTLVAGALRRTFQQRGVPIDSLDLRVIVPVDTRGGPASATSGNRVAAWFLDLPVSEPHAGKRFERVREQTRARKRSDAEQGIDLFLRFADWMGSSRLPYWGVGLVQRLCPYNLIVTNVHGPPVHLYLLGARLDSFYPTVPLFEKQGLAIAVMSYVDRVSFGILADWDVFPELRGVVDAIGASLEELRGVAYAVDLSPPGAPRGRRAPRRNNRARGRASTPRHTPPPDASRPVP